jgi:hypothetical protein
MREAECGGSAVQRPPRFGAVQQPQVAREQGRITGGVEQRVGLVGGFVTRGRRRKVLAAENE